jgi:Protein of unknown function (DUF3025)
VEAAAGLKRPNVTPAAAIASMPWPAPDWHAHWLAPLRDTGQAVERAVGAGMPLWQALNQATRAPVRFVPQSDLPPGMAYEQFIAQTGCCPTRESLHDFFNGLCWARFPATKRRLNQLQAAQIQADGVRPVRGPVRDALTLLDENAALLSAPQPLWDALRAKQWTQLFGRLRPLWQDARLVLFGHALLEKLQQPRKAITAHVLAVPLQQSTLADMDDWVAAHIDASMLADKPFAHLPVLGVPGWWPDNAQPVFYQDHAVFRPPARGVANVPQ